MILQVHSIIFRYSLLSMHGNVCHTHLKLGKQNVVNYKIYVHIAYMFLKIAI